MPTAQVFFWFLFEAETHYLSQAGLELMAILLPQLLKCWDDRSAQLHLPDALYSWVLNSMLVLPQLMQPQTSLSGAHGVEGWKDPLEASLGPLNTWGSWGQQRQVRGSGDDAM